MGNKNSLIKWRKDKRTRPSVYLLYEKIDKDYLLVPSCIPSTFTVHVAIPHSSCSLVPQLFSQRVEKWCEKSWGVEPADDHVSLHVHSLLQNAPKRAKVDFMGKENLVTTHTQKPASKPAAPAKRPTVKPAAVKATTASKKASTAANKPTKTVVSAVAGKTAAKAGSSKTGAGKPKRAAWDVKGRLQVHVFTCNIVPFICMYMYLL